MNRIVISLVLCLALAMGGVSPVVGYGIDSGAANAALENSGSALEYISLSVVPLLIMQKVMCGASDDRMAGGREPEKQKAPVHQGLSLAMPETRVVRQDISARYMPGVDGPAILHACCSEAMYFNCSAARMRGLAWCAVFLVTCLLGRPSRARGDTAGYSSIIYLVKNAVRVIPARVFSFCMTHSGNTPCRMTVSPARIVTTVTTAAVQGGAVARTARTA